MNINCFNVNNRIKYNAFTGVGQIKSLVSSVENKVTMKEEFKNYVDSSVFNQKLDQVVSEKLEEDAEIKAKQQHVTSLINGIKDKYIPIENKINSLLKQADSYDKYSKELSRDDISKEEKDDIKLKMSKIEKNIKAKMSQDINSREDKFISKTVDPEIKVLTKDLNKEINGNFQDDSFTLKSVEDLGLGYNKDDDMNTIIDKIKNASSNMENKISQLDDLEKEYGVSSGKHTLLKINKKDKADSNISKNDIDKILKLAKKLGIKVSKDDGMDTIVEKINNFMKNKDSSKDDANKKIDVYV